MARVERLKTAVFRRWASTCVILLAAHLALLGQSHTRAANPIAIAGKASTSRAAREDALRAIPFAQLSKQAQSRVMAVARSPSMFRRMPISMIDCAPDLHRFLIRHPEIVVNIWQLMGITKVTTDRTGPYQLSCSDGVGTVTDWELIYGNSGTHLIFCEGSYNGPLFRKPVKGRCVLLLKSGHVPAGDDGYHITNRLDVFLQIDHAGVEVLTRTLHPLFGRSADINFLESMKFLQRISFAAKTNGPGMRQLCTRLDNVQPEVRDKFEQVVTSVSEEQRLAKSTTTPQSNSR